MKPTSPSRPRQPPQKPAKPRPDFPLFPHATRRWAKKVRGKLVYFGPWNDPQGALDKWLAVKDDLLSGRAPRATGDGPTVRDLVNRFLTAKKAAVDCGELAPQTFADYHRNCGVVVKVFGATRLASDLRSDDFERLRGTIAQNCGPAHLAVEVVRIRSIFRYAYESQLLDQPMRYGPSFKGPSQSVLRRARAEKPPKMFAPAELLAMLAGAGEPLRTMILLGINLGFGNNDCGRLPIVALDLEAGWVHFARPKTGVARRCPLWAESVDSLREWLAIRPEPKGKGKAADVLVFVSERGSPWLAITVGRAFRALLKRLDLYKPGLGFYGLRHTFRTVADEALDQPAADLIMGHVSHGMAAHYRERVGDDRLRRVAEHVRRWLYGDRVDQGQGDDVAILRIG